ncbi:protein of unknown function DUF58 [Pirellula staleyi DSM 6068]|uniref:DUF58 domain-containing protein n=1 Tax=Pirellula staleyi (strain ATCC 27377 / DSM 6068 / ICPB 4128) TaxID=530564 RepID=D2QX47_PIRSD|nr:DUF58 domain-containing protein [Pirellula staleyi]ADB17887.1 protein of unknown function DUF58 [Pirellula staleyi DSM 6068]
MPDSKRFLHPEAIKRIARLEIRARHVVEGFLAGMHRSPYFGQSVEFLQHREYVIGDDLRHVDWKVWARQDRLYIKQFEEETNLRCHLLVDMSTSMMYGNGHLNKFDYAATLASSLAWLILKQQDAVGCTTFDDRVRSVVPCRTKSNHILSIVESLNLVKPSDKTDMFAVLRAMAETAPRRGVVVICSDLLADRPGLFKGLRLLRQRGHEVLVFHILDNDELEFPFSGPTRFEGLESDDFLNCNPRALREGYLAAMQAFLDEVRRECARASVDYALVKTGDPLDAALATFLSKRLAVMNRY